MSLCDSICLRIQDRGHKRMIKTCLHHSTLQKTRHSSHVKALQTRTRMTVACELCFLPVIQGRLQKLNWHETEVALPRRGSARVGVHAIPPLSNRRVPNSLKGTLIIADNNTSHPVLSITYYHSPDSGGER